MPPEPVYHDSPFVIITGNLLIFCIVAFSLCMISLKYFVDVSKIKTDDDKKRAIRKPVPPMEFLSKTGRYVYYTAFALFLTGAVVLVTILVHNAQAQ